MKRIAMSVIIGMALINCTPTTDVKKIGEEYQRNHSYGSLKKAVDLIVLPCDTALVKSILGEPIDMGFDYRYTTDSVGADSCTVGAVFHIDEKGKIDNVMLDQICE